MKFLKIKLLFVFSFLSLFSLADDLAPWQAHVFSASFSSSQFFGYVQNSFSTKDEALYFVRRFIPFCFSLDSESDYNNITNLSSLSHYLNNYRGSSWAIEDLSLFRPDINRLCISNILTHESFPTKDYILNNPYRFFVSSARYNFQRLNISNLSLFSENCLIKYRKDLANLKLYFILDYEIFCNNVLNLFKNSDIEFIKQNIEFIIPYILSNFNTISNSIDRVLINSDYGISLLHNIDSNVSGFPRQLEDIKSNTDFGRIQALASATTSENVFQNPDSQAEGVLYTLYQLTRDQRGEPEKLNVTQKEAYDYLGLDKEYGSFPSISDGKRITQMVAAQVVAKTEAQTKKYQDLYSIADDDGYVTDPDTGEKVSLQDAFKNWNNQKSQGALAAYSYNNPSATNGFFGALKRRLTEESDWRLLDKNFKNKVEQFTDDVINDGIKIKNGSSPLKVVVQQDVPISINISKESFDGVVISTDSKEDIQAIRGSFNSFFELWKVYSGVTDKSSRSWLDLINENNSNYYDFVRDKLYVTLSNDLSAIVRNTSRTNDFYNSLSNQLERIISAHTVTVAETSPFEIYANQNVSTLKHPIPDAYLLHDEPYQSYQGSTNFEQAIIFMLHDQHVIAQNNLKANIMSADYIRGIYHSLYSGSNIAERVDYITNQVFSANSLSTDPDYDYSSAYSSQADELKTHLNDIVTSITEFNSQTLEKLTPIANQIFADYILPSKLTVLQFKENKFEVDLIKYRTIFDLMHYASSVAWLIIGLLMLPRVIYMLLAFSLKILGKFYNIMRYG